MVTSIAPITGTATTSQIRTIKAAAIVTLRPGQRRVNCGATPIANKAGPSITP